jgi:hypothetical protein
VLSIAALPAYGQEEFLNLLNPEFGQLHLRSDYRFTYFPDEPVAGQHADLGFTQHDVTLDAPLYQGAADEWAASFRLRAQEFDTTAVFPDSGEPFPDELWNIRFGTSYRHRFDSGWIAALTLTIGSPSDEPFASLSETDINTTAILRVPSGEPGAWLFFVNYASNREFLPGLPIPGFGYAYEPSEQLSAVVTTGFLSLRYRPIDPLTFTATYVAVRTVDGRATYVVARPVRLWVGFDWTNDRFLLADRENTDDRLFYYEKRLRAGAIIGLARQVYTEIPVGYSFDRFYFEGEDYGDRNHNRIDVGSGPFATIRLGLRF